MIIVKNFSTYFVDKKAKDQKFWDMVRGNRLRFNNNNPGKSLIGHYTQSSQSVLE